MRFPIQSGHEEFCNPTFYCESDDPKITKLAEMITKNKKTPREATETVFEWVRDNINYEVLGMVGAKKVLEKKAGCCTDKTNLFVALCRALGIPARYVMFKCRLKSPQQDIASMELTHVAAEIYVDNKWIVCDPAYEKTIGRVYEMSEFGRPTWSTWNNVKRIKSLPRLAPIIQRMVLMSSGAKKVKNAVREIRGL